MKSNSYNRKLEKYIYDKISIATNEQIVETLYGSNGKNRIYIPGSTVRMYESVIHVAKILYKSIYHENVTPYNKIMNAEEYDRLIHIIDHIFNTSELNE